MNNAETLYDWSCECSGCGISVEIEIPIPQPDENFNDIEIDHEATCENCGENNSWHMRFEYFHDLNEYVEVTGC